MYFRRRELLSLAPLGLVLVIVVTALSPGAVHGVVSQFTRSDRATVATTSDRTADYDAIRPDLWTHLLVGRGYGSYTPDTYRILDSEILTRLVDTGVLGLLAFLGIGLSVVFAARKTIARRDQQSSPVALVATAGAVCFLTVSTLYDVSGFPHATYVFLYIAGLGTVVLGRRPQPEPEAAFLNFDDLPELDPRKSDAPVPVGLTWESASDCEPSGTSASV
jgi:O-antigen ligase